MVDISFSHGRSAAAQTWSWQTYVKPGLCTTLGACALCESVGRSAPRNERRLLRQISTRLFKDFSFLLSFLTSFSAHHSHPLVWHHHWSAVFLGKCAPFTSCSPKCVQRKLFERGTLWHRTTKGTLWHPAWTVCSLAPRVISFVGVCSIWSFFGRCCGNEHWFFVTI